MSLLGSWKRSKNLGGFFFTTLNGVICWGLTQLKQLASLHKFALSFSVFIPPFFRRRFGCSTYGHAYGSSCYVILLEYRLDRVTRLSLKKKELKIFRDGISFNLCCLLTLKGNINSRRYIDKSYPIFTEIVKRKVKHN